MASAPETDAVPPEGGLVTAVEVQKNDPTRVSIFLDGAFAFGVSAEIAVRERLRPGRTLTADEQNRILAQEDLSAARTKALDYLSRRARTEWEVRKKLLDSGFATEAVNSVVSRLTELGYIDDANYAGRFAAARLERRYGPRRIFQELRRRGISPEVAEGAITSARSESDVREQALTLARQRWARLRSETDSRKRRKKIYDHLVRRGFESDLAWSVVNTLSDDESDQTTS
ncbi:MAG TPA: RecX family transcriptional regulator [Rhodothermales bacterium]